MEQQYQKRLSYTTLAVAVIAMLVGLMNMYQMAQPAPSGMGILSTNQKITSNREGTKLFVLNGGTLEVDNGGKLDIQNGATALLQSGTITNVTATTITGTLATANQKNVTNLGTQTYLTATNATITNDTISTGAITTLTVSGSATLPSMTNVTATNGSLTSATISNGSVTTLTVSSSATLPSMTYITATNLAVGSNAFSGAVRGGTVAAQTDGASITHGFTVTPTWCVIAPTSVITAGVGSITSTGFAGNVSATGRVYWSCGF